MVRAPRGCGPALALEGGLPWERVKVVLTTAEIAEIAGFWANLAETLSYTTRGPWDKLTHTQARAHTPTPSIIAADSGLSMRERAGMASSSQRSQLFGARAVRACVSGAMRARAAR